MVRLAIITTHPIQYNAPLFKELSKHITLKVFYTWSQAQGKIIDKDFGIAREWDIPLLEGYHYTFVNNTSSNPGSSHFNGINNPTLINDIEAWSAQAVLVFGWAFVSHLKALRYFYKKIPVLFRGDSTLLDEPKGFSIKKIARTLFLKWVYSHTDYALYVGSANKKYFMNHGVSEDQLIFAPHAIDNKRFEDNTDDVRPKKNELGIGSDDTVLLFAGKLIQKKNPELLIRSFLRVAKSEGSLKLIVAGKGELEDALKKRYEKESNVFFVGFQNQSAMPTLYRVADLFVLPSQGPGETWGLAVNEAMACGKAVLVSDRCGCAADLVQQGSNGYVFKSGDETDLSEKISLLVKSKQVLQASGKASFALIQRWNYGEIVLAIEGLMKKM